MADYGQAIGSVIGAKMVVGAVGMLTKKKKKFDILNLNYNCKRKRK
jgi:hypothetical protein